MARLRIVGSALESYNAEFKQYPKVSTPQDLARTLVPTYLTKRGLGPDGALIDEWDRPLRYESWKESADAPGCDHYAIASAGDDGKFDAKPLRSVTEGSFDNADEDIVYRDSSMVRYPAFPQPENP